MWDSFNDFFLNIWPLLRLWDIVDILLVTFFFYRILVLIKGTRTGQMVFGLILVLVCFWMARHFEIRTVNAIFGKIFDNLFIILLLLFQQDIRRALSQVGKASFFASGDVFHDGQIMEELIKSVVSLSNKKIGALIVLEQQADVLEFVEAGTTIDCQLSKEMLTSIFLPVSPLHDGAVLVRKGRIHMAGCFLPLTLNPMVSKAVGTRHRAAVGLTEETDALCIVVSEENGHISLASGGKIRHNLDAPQLRKALLEYA